MIKKECKDVCIQALLLVAAPVIIMSLVMTLIHSTPGSETSFADFFYPLLQADLLFFSLFLGISLFSSERRNQGMEYILSLPYSRMKLLIYKMVPRVAMMCLLYVIFLSLQPLGGANRLFITTPSFTYIYFILFVVSLYFSVASDNFVVSAMAGMMTVGVVLAVILGSFLVANTMRGGPSWEVDGTEILQLGSLPKLMIPILLALTLPFLISFIVSFKRVDIRPVRQFNKRYFKIFVPLIIIALALSVIMAYHSMDSDYRSYYLTGKMQLFESNWYGTKVYSQGDVSKIDDMGGWWWSAVEKDDFLYDMCWDREEGYLLRRLNLNTLGSDTLYKPDGKTKLGYHLFLHQYSLLFFEIHNPPQKAKGTYLVKLDLDSKKMDRIKIEVDGVNLNSRLIGTDKLDGERFWLVSVRGLRHFTDHKGYIIYRIWESGRQEEISRLNGSHVYLNHQLITTGKQGLVFERLTSEGKEQMKIIPEGKNLHLPIWWRRNLDNLPVKEIYCSINQPKKEDEIYVLNLENHELKLITRMDGWLHYFYPDETFLIVQGKQEHPTSPWNFKELHHLKNGSITLIKKFEPPAERIEWGINRSGLILREGDKIKAYIFPDMKEIIYKK